MLISLNHDHWLRIRLDLMGVRNRLTRPLGDSRVSLIRGRHVSRILWLVNALNGI